MVTGAAMVAAAQKVTKKGRKNLLIIVVLCKNNTFLEDLQIFMHKNVISLIVCCTVKSYLLSTHLV